MEHNYADDLNGVLITFIYNHINNTTNINIILSLNNIERIKNVSFIFSAKRKIQKKEVCINSNMYGRASNFLYNKKFKNLHPFAELF